MRDSVTTETEVAASCVWEAPTVLRRAQFVAVRSSEGCSETPSRGPKAGGSLDDPQARQKESSFEEFHGRRFKQLDATRRSHDTLGVYHLAVVLCSRGGGGDCARF